MKLIAACIVSFLITLVTGRFLLPELRRLKAGQSIREAREFEVQVWVEEFLVQRVLCGYCGAQQKDHSGVYPKST